MPKSWRYAISSLTGSTKQPPPPRKTIAKTYTEWRKVIERKDIDAVFIATPPHLHSEMAVAALQAGKHVYCEKPIGVTRRSGPRRCRGRQEVQQSIRTRPATAISERISASDCEDSRGTSSATSLMLKAQRHAPRDLAHDGSSGDWYFDVTKSGGYLIEQSVHNLDFCNWVIGAHPIAGVWIRRHANVQERSSGPDDLRLRQSSPTTTLEV